MNDQQAPANGHDALALPKCPLPTPELVAALANQYIEEKRGAYNGAGPLTRAFEKIVGSFVESDPRHRLLCIAAEQLATTLNEPAPYQTQVTLADGRQLEPERHTITYFTDGEGFTGADWAAISALDVGEAYIVQGSEAAMTVMRVE